MARQIPAEPTAHPAMQRDAVFDRTGRYRYLLTRRWASGGPSVAFVLLNPSTADAQRDDPTIRRCMNFAREWGFSALEVVNLFAFRATRPQDLRRASRPVGPRNDAVLRESVGRVDRTVVAWGIHGAWHGRDLAVLSLLVNAGVQPDCLGTTQAGQPRHVLYLPRNSALRRYKGWSGPVMRRDDPHTAGQSETARRPAHR